MHRRSLLPSLPALLACALTIAAQSPSASLQTAVSIEKTLAAGQTHRYVVAVEKHHFVQLTVAQNNIDVVVRVFLPEGKLLAEFDSPTGAEGVEHVEFVAESAGNYRVEISQLHGGDASGQYQIKIEELRKATEQELQAFKNERTRKEKGLALLNETTQYLDQLRLPETRIDLKIKAARLMWEVDQKRASKLIGQASADARELIAQMIARNDPDYKSYQTATQLRQRLIRTLALRDPEAALNFFKSTRIPAELAVGSGEADPEVQVEFQLVNQVVAADPKRAFDLAQDLLKRSSSHLLIETLTRLVSKDRDLAGRLAHDMAAKLMQQDLVKTREAAYLASSFLNVIRSSETVTFNGAGSSRSRLISDDDFRDLFLKMVGEIMSYSPSSNAINSPDHDVVRSLASIIREMSDEVKTHAADRAAAIDKKIIELIGETNQPGTDWQRYTTAANATSVDTAIASINEAPPQMRDFLYQEVATRIANAGDSARARQIVSDNIADPTQRRTALNALRQQAVTSAANKGQFDEAFRLLSDSRPGPERDDLVTQILEELGPGVKKQLALQYLSQGKNLITSSARAENQQQMYSLLAIARLFARYDLNQAFEIVEPLLDQFGEISAAAVAMNGFDRDYYREGELVTSSENPISQTANQFSETLATLAMFDFDRAKSAAEGINRLDIRLRIFLLIAHSTMAIQVEPDEAQGYGGNR